ncbi:MAG: xylan 1,4-beta-xylosidase [Alphaproteobacteria bacterium]|nr:MAG: xylan 1,4-beta-xylosidase [Alphaproteobacteria bacterium]
MDTTRRDAFRMLLAAPLAGTAVAAGAVPAQAQPCPTGTPAPAPRWGRGFEGQRIADLGDGTFLNPIVAGDHADPTILKDGDDYYMTFSSFSAYPGVVIWHSRDLVNWVPVGPAVRTPVGSIWAMDLIKHDGRYFIYIPCDGGGRFGIYVVWADDIRGPWSEPIDLGLYGHIDPGHAVGEDGKRYLFVAGVKRVRLADDGLATDGDLEQAFEPWHYPADWVVEMFAPEGPKIVRREGWFYLITAVGGTSGPPTSHMVVVARSASIHGPWEHCPMNPLVRTTSADEPWWSRGHASIVEGPAGDWWMVYHGYENDFRTLGRETLLEPIDWTDDGWFVARGGDLSAPMPKPVPGPAGPAGFPLSDDFSTDRFGVNWSFHAPAQGEMARVKYGTGGLTVAGKGTGPATCSPMTCIAPDLAYEATISFELQEGGEGGLLLFYDDRMFVGVGFSGSEMRTFNYGQEHSWMRMPMQTGTVSIRLRNDRNVVTFHYSHDGGKSWVQHPWQMEVSGMHHNVLGGFLSLKPAIYSAGDGAVRFRDFRYRALP